MVAGFDEEQIIPAGQRMEIVNQFHDEDASTFERSEFKRLSSRVKTHREGYALLEIDPPIRNAPIPSRTAKTGSHSGQAMHNPVIFQYPEMKGRLMNGSIQYIDKPLKAMDIVFDVLEDLTE